MGKSHENTTARVQLRRRWSAFFPPDMGRGGTESKGSIKCCRGSKIKEEKEKKWPIRNRLIYIYIYIYISYGVDVQQLWKWVQRCELLLDPDNGAFRLPPLSRALDAVCYRGSCVHLGGVGCCRHWLRAPFGVRWKQPVLRQVESRPVRGWASAHSRSVLSA